MIDADALKARIMVDVPGFLDGGSSVTKAFILVMLETRKATPTIDAVPVVRCKDCKHYETKDCANGFGWCNRNGTGHGSTDDWYCADGERREER